MLLLASLLSSSFHRGLPHGGVRHNQAALLGLSPLTQYLILLDSVLWILLGLSLHSTSVFLPAVIYVPIALYTLYLIGRASASRMIAFLSITAVLSLFTIAIILSGMPHWLVIFVNFAAPILAFSMFIPQAVTSWRNRHDYSHLLGISLGTQGLIILNATSWAVVAMGLGSSTVV